MLERQVDDILVMYDLAEKAYPYQNIREEKSLNEDEQRRRMAAFSSYGVGSAEIVQGCQLYGLGSLFLFSRWGAKSVFDMTMVRQCWVRSASFFMIGVTYGMLKNVAHASKQIDSGNQLMFHRRVHQNEQTHSILRAMKFHLATRQDAGIEQLNH